MLNKENLKTNREKLSSIELESISDGIYMLRLPLPYALDHVNVWLLEGHDSWSIIDTGLGDQVTYRIWQNLLAGFLSSKPIRKLVLTHYHPDHTGLSGDIQARTQAEVFMSTTEWLTANMLYHDQKGILGNNLLQHMYNNGLPESFSDQLAKIGLNFSNRVSKLPLGYTTIKDKDIIELADQKWQCIAGQGHSPEHISLYNKDKRILIAGDHILPKITPNISLPVQNQRADPLADYLKSLKRFKKLSDDCHVLPSHGMPFYGLHERITQISEHHKQRLEKLLSACDQPISAYDSLPVLFKSNLDSNQIIFAMLEALSHLVYLENKDKIKHTKHDGITKFVKV